MTSAARMSDGAAGIEPGDWGPGPPPPVFGIPPPPLPDDLIYERNLLFKYVL